MKYFMYHKKGHIHNQGKAKIIFLDKNKKVEEGLINVEVEEIYDEPPL